MELTLKDSVAKALYGPGGIGRIDVAQQLADVVLHALGLDDLDAAAKRMEHIDPRSVPDQESWHRAMLQEALSPLATTSPRDSE